MLSLTPTSSASVELRVLIFCLVDEAYRAPFPMLNMDPVWLLMSGCTAKDASIHHWIRSMSPLPSSVKGNSIELGGVLECRIRSSTIWPWWRIYILRVIVRMRHWESSTDDTNEIEQSTIVTGPSMTVD